jgi:phosphatidylglycerol:prolipoprotein diacylglycerol transferase
MPRIQSTAYGFLMLAAIVVSNAFWWRLARRDNRLMIIYVAALASAFLGAKLVYFGAEGWMHWHDSNRWIQFATGKSILGGLLGGYLGVEIAKRSMGYTGSTGDWFAVIVPIGIMMGRVGCVLHGCCLGRVCEPAWFTTVDVTGAPRWPAAWAELFFNAIMLAAILAMLRRGVLRGQLFHVYLIAYGVFRFGHEFMRMTPRLAGPFSGFQFFALALLLLGVVGFARRRKEMQRGELNRGVP